MVRLRPSYIWPGDSPISFTSKYTLTRARVGGGGFPEKTPQTPKDTDKALMDAVYLDKHPLYS